MCICLLSLPSYSHILGRGVDTDVFVHTEVVASEEN